jgi:predicted molibdopterin-dependent oxidoreductase YjgC
VEYKNVLTTCPYCGTGCSLYLEVLDGRVVGTLPVKGHPVSDGRLCVKGWNAHSFVYHPERLTQPMIRDQRGGPLREATWDEALGLVARRLKEIKAEHGPDSIGFFSSAKCTNEENYLLQKLARAVIGTNNVDHCARL